MFPRLWFYTQRRGMDYDNYGLNFGTNNEDVEISRSMMRISRLMMRISRLMMRISRLMMLNIIMKPETISFVLLYLYIIYFDILPVMIKYESAKGIIQRAAKRVKIISRHILATHNN